MSLLDAFNVQAFHSAALTTDTAIYNFPINFVPDQWVVVARLSAGNISASPETGPGALSFRTATGTIHIPIPSQTLTITTAGATGFFDVYAVKNLDGFDIES